MKSAPRLKSTLAICLAIVISSAATATAGKLITGAQIKNNTITGADIKNGSITSADLASNVLTAGPAGAAGTNGKDGKDGVDGIDGTARAYASVIPGDPPTLAAGKLKGVVSVTNPNLGAYCLELESGIDADSVTPVATVDYWNSPSAVSFVQVHATNQECTGTNQIEIITRASNGIDFANNIGFYVIVP